MFDSAKLSAHTKTSENVLIFSCYRSLSHFSVIYIRSEQLWRIYDAYKHSNVFGGNTSEVLQQAVSRNNSCLSGKNARTCQLKLANIAIKRHMSQIILIAVGENCQILFIP